MASRIGSVGGDVVSIEILQRDDGVVVDELGVGLGGEHLIDLLRDEILGVDGGRIVERGPHGQLVAQGGSYAELYHTQYLRGAAPSPA